MGWKNKEPPRITSAAACVHCTTDRQTTALTAALAAAFVHGAFTFALAIGGQALLVLDVVTVVGVVLHPPVAIGVALVRPLVVVLGLVVIVLLAQVAVTVPP